MDPNPYRVQAVQVTSRRMALAAGVAVDLVDLFVHIARNLCILFFLFPSFFQVSVPTRIGKRKVYITERDV